MIIVRTPLRVSFFGGGTDHPVWFKGAGANRGAVLSTSINKYVYLTLRRLPPIFDFKYRIAWRIVEQVNNVDDIKHPVVREVLRHYTVDDGYGFEVSFNSDLPARSGLGSSSAFTVAALHAISRHSGAEYSKKQLCLEAIKLEQEYLQEPVGCQDQIAVGHGGFNRIDFHQDGSYSVLPVDISPRRLRSFESHLMMFFTGFTRDAGSIEKSKFENITAAKEISLNRLYDLVGRAHAIVEDPRADLQEFGNLLHETWMAKRTLSSAVSNSKIDTVYDSAINAGAFGGKLLGAGGGGFLLFFVHPDRHMAVGRALNILSKREGINLVQVPICMEGEGSSVVLHQPDFESVSRYAPAKVDLLARV
ncbi:MAG TPA: hypothetical protein V6C97_31660 [Oculatellaceae cyanobacterium]